MKPNKLKQAICVVSLCLLLKLLLGLSPNVAAHEDIVPVPEEIRREAALPNNSPIGYPLPLSSEWNTGTQKNSFNPAYQMDLIEAGHYLLPCFKLTIGDTQIPSSYYEEQMKKAAELRLPISFVSSQWERMLTTEEYYFTRPVEGNPNVINSNGKVLKKVSPFGAINPWKEVGLRWTQNSIVKNAQERYPDPPLVLFISNNEHSKLNWQEADTDIRYVVPDDGMADDNFKRKVVGEGWITRYRALQEGMRNGLISNTWKRTASFIGYEAFGPSYFARWNGWTNYSLYSPERITPWPLAWDGGSVSFYVQSWNDCTDFRVWSPQIQAMNWVFMQQEALRLNPRFWFEISTWDGHSSKSIKDKHKYYKSLGQTYTPERYSGMIQFGMWLLRPRVVRELGDWTGPRSDTESYFLAVVNAVDFVHNNKILRKFWRLGQLVANKTRQHPYQTGVPNEYKAADRWFLLDTDNDTPRPWKLDTEIPVFSLALVMHNPPEREWLIYSHSPLKNRKGVEVTVPSYGPVLIDVTPAGTFYLIREKDRQIVQVDETE